MASEHWFRWHHGSVTDPKWRVIASRCVTSVTVGHVVTVWAAMLENASQASPRGTLSGWDDEDVAALFGYEIEQVSAIREAMQGKVLDGYTLLAWQKRQPNREDSSSSRTREYRDRKRDAKKRSVTQCDATKRNVTLETETETETETEEKEQKQNQNQKQERTREPQKRGTRLPSDWKPSETELRWARDARPDLDARAEVERFADYWHCVAGHRGVKLDWPATWRNWVRRADAPQRNRNGGAADAFGAGLSPAAMRRLA